MTKRVDLLVQQMYDENASWQVRAHAIAQLGKIGGDKAITALIRALAADGASADQLRFQAVSALAYSGDRRAVPALLARF